MAEKRQKKQAVKAFEKETFSKDKEVTGAKHTEHRQDNTFPTENHFHANEKPVSNLPRDANHGSHRRNATSGHSVQKWKGKEMNRKNMKKLLLAVIAVVIVAKIARDIMKARKQKENIHADTFEDFYEEEMNWWDKDLEEGEE